MLEKLMIPPMAQTKQIAYKASRKEWDAVLDWIESATETFMESANVRNPWLMPELSPEDHSKRLEYAAGSHGIIF